MEVHNIQFVASDSPGNVWSGLRETRFGDSDNIHIDGFTTSHGQMATRSLFPQNLMSWWKRRIRN
ncbi:DUF1543 domain-containing protein [Salmonella enterica]